MTDTPQEKPAPLHGWLLLGALLPVADLLMMLLRPALIPPWLHPAALLSALAVAAALYWHGRRCQRLALQLQDGINALDEGFALFDADDRLVMLNEAYRRLYPRLSQDWQPGVRPSAFTPCLV